MEPEAPAARPAREEDRDLPRCPGGWCMQPGIHEEFMEICRQVPPSGRVIVPGPDGGFCYCVCGDP